MLPCPAAIRESYAQNRARAQALDARQARIRGLNDQLRTTLVGGRVVITAALQAFGPVMLANVLDELRRFDQFDTDNDPYGEHDLGGFTVGGERILFKIDYYDKALEFGSLDPADPDVTARVLTIMLASDY